MPMRILDIRERTVAVPSPRRNASVGFDEMTASAVAVLTDARRDGQPVIGYIDLRAEMDVLAAISACPADTSPTNNFRSAPLGIKVFG